MNDENIQPQHPEVSQDGRHQLAARVRAGGRQSHRRADRVARHRVVSGNRQVAGSRTADRREFDGGIQLQYGNTERSSMSTFNSLHNRACGSSIPGRRSGPRRREFYRAVLGIDGAEAGIRRFRVLLSRPRRGQRRLPGSGRGEMSRRGGILVYLNVDGRDSADVDCPGRAARREGEEPVRSIGPQVPRASVPWTAKATGSRCTRPVDA